MRTKIRITTAKVDERSSERGRDARHASEICCLAAAPHGDSRKAGGATSPPVSRDARRVTTHAHTHLCVWKREIGGSVDRKGGYLRPSRIARMARMTKGADLPMNS